MNIAFVCDEYPPSPHGGIGTFVQTIGRALVAAGHRVVVVGTAATPDRFEDSGVEVVQLRCHRGPGISCIMDRLAVRRYLTSQVRAGALDIIEVPDYLGSFPFPFTLCPVVVRLHLAATVIARQLGVQPSRMCEWCERQTISRFRNWIGVSKYSLDLTVQEFGVLPVESTVVYYPVSLPERQQIAAPERFVLFAGTVGIRKGALLLAQAASRFLANHPDLHLVYAGGIETMNGTSVADTIREIVGPDLAGRVHFAGRVNRQVICEYMRRASLFVFPSRLETFGIVVAEAMLSGCPVVVPATPPFTEFVLQDDTGILVSSWDPAAWICRIEDVIRNPAFAHGMGQRARTSIGNQCDVARAVVSTLAYYDRIAYSSPGQCSLQRVIREG